MGSHNISQGARCPADILILIFEELCYTTPASLRAVRLASKEFNILVDPIVYRSLKLNKEIVKCFDLDDEPNVSPQVADARRRVANAICTFTRQITIDRPLNWSLIVNILQSLDQFHQLNWHFWETKGLVGVSRPSQILQSILSCLAERWPSAKLSVDGLSSRPEPLDKFQFLPATNLVFLKLQGFLGRHSRFLEDTLKIRTFLLQCDHLSVLHLLLQQSGARFLDEGTEQSERLPPIEELYLQGYFWLHSPSIANSFWNWSRLTSLRLEKVFIINFLESVLPENLLQLRSLITDGHCENPVENTKATNLMIKLVRAIHSLEDLSLVCSVEMFPVDAIRRHAPGLRTLQLRDYSGMVHLPLRRSQVRTLSLHALLEIQSSCPKLMELALDLDQGMMSSSFTSLLLECRNLRRLTVFVQQPFLDGVDLNKEAEICPHIGKGDHASCLSRDCQKVESIEVGTASNFVDRTYMAICTLFQDLMLRKQGAAFEKLTIHIAGHCERIYPDVLSAEGQRRQLRGDSQKRTFVYEAKQVNGRPVASFEKQLVQETMAESVGKVGIGILGE